MIKSHFHYPRGITSYFQSHYLYEIGNALVGIVNKEFRTENPDIKKMTFQRLRDRAFHSSDIPIYYYRTAHRYCSHASLLSRSYSCFSASEGENVYLWYVRDRAPVITTCVCPLPPTLLEKDNMGFNWILFRLLSLLVLIFINTMSCLIDGRIHF